MAISESKFFASRTEAISFLRNRDMVREANVDYRGRVVLGAADLAHLPIGDQWRLRMKKNDFDVRLIDDSVLGFVFAQRPVFSVQYSWLECPFKVSSREEISEMWLEEQLGSLASEIDSSDLQELLSTDSLEIDSIVESSLESAPLKAAVTPLRFEYDSVNYSSGSHPVSHLHVGCDNNVRFGCRRVMTPLSFTFLVIRQAYPDIWRKALDAGEIDEHLGNIRDNLPQVADAFWGSKDQLELFLN